MMDLTNTITAKSDQLNADDLVGGPITITIADIKAIESDKQQPIAIYYGDAEGKAYRPCKSMRRVLVAIWGKDGKQFVGRRMTLFRDPTVTWGGVCVGGIRISHMSNMATETTLVMSASKTKKKPIKILPLIDEVDLKTAVSQLANQVGEANINAYLISINWIKEGENYNQLAENYCASIIDNAGSFMAAVNDYKNKGQQ